MTTPTTTEGTYQRLPFSPDDWLDSTNLVSEDDTRKAITTQARYDAFVCPGCSPDFEKFYRPDVSRFGVGQIQRSQAALSTEYVVIDTCPNQPSIRVLSMRRKRIRISIVRVRVYVINVIVF